MWGRRDFHLEPPYLSESIFPEVVNLRLGGHLRCLFITSILIIMMQILSSHVVTRWCFPSCERLLRARTDSRNDQCECGGHWTPPGGVWKELEREGQFLQLIKVPVELCEARDCRAQGL